MTNFTFIFPSQIGLSGKYKFVRFKGKTKENQAYDQTLTSPNYDILDYHNRHIFEVI